MADISKLLSAEKNKKNDKERIRKYLEEQGVKFDSTDNTVSMLSEDRSILDKSNRYTLVGEKEKKVLDAHKNEKASAINSLNKQVLQVPITDKKTITIGYGTAKAIDDFVEKDTKGNAYQRADRLDKMIANMGLDEKELASAKSYAGIKKLSFSKPKHTDNKIAKEATQPFAKAGAGFYKSAEKSVRNIIKRGFYGLLDGGAYDEAWKLTDEYYTENPDALGNDLYAYKDNFDDVTSDYLGDVGLEKALEYYDDTFKATKFISDAGFKSLGEMAGAAAAGSFFGFGDATSTVGNAAKSIVSGTKIGNAMSKAANISPQIKNIASSGVAAKAANKAIDGINKVSVGSAVKFLNPFENSTTLVMGMNSAQDKYDQLISQGYDKKTAKANALFTGYVNTITEKMGFDGKPGSMFTINGKTVRGDITTSAMKNAGNTIGKYFSASVSEGMEEVYALMFERIGDVLSKVGYIDENGKLKQRTLFGKEGIFDINAMGQNFLSGFVGGAVMSGAGLISQLSNSDVKTVHTYADKVKKFVEQSNSEIKEAAMAVGIENIDFPQAPKWENASVKEIADYAKETTGLYKKIMSDERVAEHDMAVAEQISDYTEVTDNIVLQNDDTVNNNSVSIGDAFKDTKTGNIIRVVSRNANNTVVEIDTGSKVERRSYTNAQTNVLKTNEQYQSIGVSESNNYGNTVAMLQKMKQNISKMNNEPIVFNVHNEDVSKGKNATETITAHFKSIGGAANNPILGKVELTKSGAKSTVFHGVGKDKITAVLAIKDVIEKGKILNHETNWKNRGYDTYLIMGKGVLNNRPTMIGVVVKSYPNTEMPNKFYVHEVIKIGANADMAGNQALTHVNAVTPITDNIVSQNDEIVNSNNMPNVSENMPVSTENTTAESAKITVGMSDDVRAELLNKKSVNVVSVDAENTKALDNVDLDALQNSYPSYARPIIKKIARDFGILNEPFFNPDIELEFSYSGDSIQESINKQHSRYGDFVKMLSVFSDVIENAVGVETHKDKYTGTRREDTNLKQMYVLASAFRDEKGVYPVKLEVKEFKKNTNKLYLSVVLTKKESRYLSGNLGQDQLNTAPPTSTISISDLVGIVNPSEGDFLKYFPDSMLDSEQIEGKNKALAKDAEKIEKLSEDKKRSLATAENADALSYTPETTNSTASTDIVSQDNDTVNSSVHSEAKKDTKTEKVTQAIKNSLRPEITSNPTLMAMLQERFGEDGFATLASDIILTYNQNGNIGEYEALFADGGTAVYDALAKNTDAKISTDVLNDEANGDIIKDDDIETSYSIDADDSTLYLPRREYAMVARAIMAKNAGIEDSELKPVDYVYAADAFYVYRNTAVGDFAVIDRFDVEDDFERIDVLKGLIEDGIYTNTDRERLNRLIDNVRSRKRSDTGNNVRTKNRRTAVEDDRVLGGQSRSNSVRHSSGVGENNSSDEVSYAFDANETQIQQQTDNDVKFSIANIIGKKQSYGVGVYLDTNIFNGIKPRNWNSVLARFVYDNLAGKTITVFDDNGVLEEISFAKANERVRKNGANNSHKVIDKIARAKGNINSLAIVHIDELLQTSKEFNRTSDNSHQWLDQNGWTYRKSYLIDKKGQIYETTLNIAKTKDGRSVLYALSNTKKVDDGVVFSASNEEELAHNNQLSSSIISQNDYVVNSNISGNFENDTRESEASINEQSGNNILLRSSERTDDASAGEQTGRLRENEFKAQGKTGAERKSTAAELRAKGHTKQEVISVSSSGKIGKIQIELINSDVYNDDMRSMVEAYGKLGIEVELFLGDGKVAFDGARNFVVNGFKVGSSKMYLRYDGTNTPQTLGMHELIHINWNSQAVQSAKDQILDSLTEEEKDNILASERYQGYMEIYNGNTDAVWQEFVADTMSGMNEYTVTFSNIVAEYWQSSPGLIDIYKVSEYTESIDTGDAKQQLQKETLTKIKYNPSGLKLTASEREKVYSAISTDYYNQSKTHEGLQYQSCVTDTDHILYIYEDGGFGYYNVVAKVDYADEDIAIAIMEVMNNEKIDTVSNLINRIAEVLELRRSGYSIYNAYTKKIRRSGRNATLHKGQSSGNQPGRTNANSSRTGRTGRGNESTGRRISDFQGNSSNEENDLGISYSLAGENTEFWDEWLAKIKEYGVIPTGEKPTRDIEVPNKINKKQYVSRFARTMMEAEVTPDDALPEFERLILEGKMIHEAVTDKKAHEDAIDKIKREGFAETLNTWDVMSKESKIGKNELALGMELYNQCITNKDITNAMKIAAGLAAEATRAGQTLQACRMLKLMSPDGQLYYLERSVQKINDEFREKLRKKFKDIELDEALMTEFFNAPDEESRNAVYDEICKDIADQIPSSMRDKWSSWRYLAMLGNLRTHMRNIVGNAVFVPAIRIKNYVGAVIESTARVNSADRTKSYKKTRAAIEFAKKDFDVMEKTIRGENAKYAITSDIDSKRTIFKTKWLEKLRIKNFDFLEAEDLWFLKLHYVDALARVITARKLNVDTLDGNALDTARAYAIKEAQAATYRDANELADALNKLQRRAERSGSKIVRGSSVLIEGVMPFKKTPMNIAKQGVQYSPVSIITGAYKGLNKLKDGTAFSTSEVIDDFAKGLTGTGIMLLGYFLTSIGTLCGPEDENKKKKAFDKMVGEQSYALKIGDNTYTIDWMVPSALPLFVGTELYKLTKDGFAFADVVDAVSTLAEPLLELSVFSGINETLEAARFNELQSLIAIGNNAVSSYFLQALPTIGGQISRMLDKNKRQYYYIDKTIDIPWIVQNFIGKAASKVPYASKLFEPVVDEWGREVTYGNVFERVLENVASPGYYSKTQYTTVDKELKDLYERTDDSSVLPVIQQKFYKEEGIEYNMTAKEYTEVKRIRGQRSFELLEKLISNKKAYKDQKKQYSNMTDEEKINAIKKCYDIAGAETKEEMIEQIKK